MAWDEDRFWNASPSYFFKALKGFNDLEHERDKVEWERTRMLGYWIVSPHTKKGTNLTPQRLLPLPWDKVETRDEWLKRNERFKQAWDNMK